MGERATAWGIGILFEDLPLVTSGASLSQEALDKVPNGYKMTSKLH